MRLRIGSTIALLSLMSVAGHPGDSVAVEDVSPLLEPIRVEHRLPALAGSIFAHGRTVAIGATGQRARGRNDRVRADDRWHLGSCTKAMTATLAALLVEEGVLSWQTTLGELYPKQTAAQPAWRPVTLEQLLQHRSGLPKDRAPGAPWLDVELRGPLQKQRLDLVGARLARAPESAPGSAMRYANAGYVIAAAMLETRTGLAWEELMRERLFEPLGMSSAGFGPPSAPQPQGHWKGRALGAGPNADNPPVLGPANSVHVNLEDWGKFIALHVAGPTTDTERLSRSSFTRMHTPASDNGYAMGWIATERSWGGRVLSHAGSNTFWYAVVWAAPERGFAVLVTTNEGGDHAAAGTDAAASALILHHLSGEQR